MTLLAESLLSFRMCKSVSIKKIIPKIIAVMVYQEPTNCRKDGKRDTNTIATV